MTSQAPRNSLIQHFPEGDTFEASIIVILIMGILICLISVNNRGCTAVAIFLIALILLVWVLIKMNDHIPIEPHLPCHVALSWKSGVLFLCTAQKSSRFLPKSDLVVRAILIIEHVLMNI